MSESPDDFDDKGNLIGMDDAREPEAVVEPEPEPEAEPEPAEEPEAEPEPEPEPAAAEAAEEAEEEPPRDTRKDWRDRQIIKRNKELAEEKVARKAAEDRAAALEALYGNQEGDDPAARATLTTLTKEEARREALEEVRQEQYFKNLNTAAETMFEAGAKAFPKSWQTRVSQAAEIFKDEIIARPEFLEVVTGLDNAATVYHALAGDPDKFESILQMPSAKMGAELAKMSITLAKKPTVAVSRTPAPIKPLDKPTVEDLPLDDPNLSQEEFNRRMDAAEAKRYGGR